MARLAQPRAAPMAAAGEEADGLRVGWGEVGAKGGTIVSKQEKPITQEAAKALLEACKVAADYIEHCGFGGNNRKAEVECIKDLRAAIKKAEGGG